MLGDPVGGPHSPLLSPGTGIHPLFGPRPLQWLHRMKDTNARITRWYLVEGYTALQIQGVHRPGTQMTVADFLSRKGGGGAAGRRASRPESGGGGMWRGGRGSAKSAAGERLRRQR